MAYRDDIAALGADHHWIFEDDYNDDIGVANGTNTGTILTDAAIAEDANNSMTTDALTERVTLPTTTTINNSAQQRKAVCGWYMTTAFQAPPSIIYGEGTDATNFQFVFGFGNNVMFECTEPTNFSDALQVYGPALVPNRAYHLCGIFLGNTQGNEIKFFVDGVEQTLADPSDRQPDTADLNSRGVGIFGDPSGTVGIGGGVVLQQAARNGRYNHWAAWGDEADADLTDTEIRETLFERGALADSTIAAGTESAMQTSLDAIATAQDNAPLNIEVAAVTGGGNFTLTSDKVFDALSSCHYRYNGTADQLTIVNIDGGNASIGAAPFGGTIVIATRQTLTVTVLDVNTGAAIEGARVYITADTGGDLTAGTIIMNELTNASGVATTTFDYTSDQPVISRVRKASSSTYYKTAPITSTLTSVALTTTVFMVPDE